MSDAEARTVLENFWKGCGLASIDEYTRALSAAYELGDKREFKQVLCEIATEDLALDVVSAFVHRFSAAQ
jgi:hypothetical protein